MQLDYHYLSEMDKKEICDWHYEGEYNVYDLPSYQVMCDYRMCFCHPINEKNYLGYYEKQQLIGYTCLEKRKGKLYLAIGVKPSCCNHGYGQQMLNIICDLAKQQYPNENIYLEVRTWNKRAIHCYEKVGFRIVGKPYLHLFSTGPVLFYEMMKNQDKEAA